MEAPFSICTKEEIRGVIRFLFAEGVKPVEIIRRMQAEYGDNCLLHSKIYEWIYHFRRPSTSRNENSIQDVEKIIWKNRRITVDDIAEALNIRHGSTYST
jgi:IS30 family transposase